MWICSKPALITSLMNVRFSGVISLRFLCSWIVPTMKWAIKNDEKIKDEKEQIHNAITNFLFIAQQYHEKLY